MCVTWIKNIAIIKNKSMNSHVLSNKSYKLVINGSENKQPTQLRSSTTSNKNDLNYFNYCKFNSAYDTVDILDVFI